MRGRSAFLVGFSAALAAALGLLALLVRAPEPGGPAAVSASAVRAPGDTPATRVAHAPPATAADDPPADAAAPAELHELAWGEPPGAGAGGPAGAGDVETAPPIPRPRSYEPTAPRDARRYEIHRIYNRREFEEAAAAAEAWLEEHPRDREMLRIAASAACILGDRDEAAELLARMVHRDQMVIRDRCARHGVVLDP